jgi:hypothetical protein
MRYPLFVGVTLFCCIGASIQSQDEPVSGQMSRMAATGKLWATIKYFHPSVVMITVTLIVLLARAVTLDDTYLTFRYARHFAQGYGIVLSSRRPEHGSPPGRSSSSIEQKFITEVIDSVRTWP